MENVMNDNKWEESMVSIVVDLLKSPEFKKATITNTMESIAFTDIKKVPKSLHDAAYDAACIEYVFKAQNAGTPGKDKAPTWLIELLQDMQRYFASQLFMKELGYTIRQSKADSPETDKEDE